MKCKMVKAVELFGEEAQKTGRNWPVELGKSSKVMVLNDDWAFIRSWVKIFVADKKLSHLETLVHLNCHDGKNWDVVRDIGGGVCEHCGTRPPKDVDTLACLLTEGLK